MSWASWLPLVGVVIGAAISVGGQWLLSLVQLKARREELAEHRRQETRDRVRPVLVNLTEHAIQIQTLVARAEDGIESEMRWQRADLAALEPMFLLEPSLRAVGEEVTNLFAVYDDHFGDLEWATHSRSAEGIARGRIFKDVMDAAVDALLMALRTAADSLAGPDS